MLLRIAKHYIPEYIKNEKLDGLFSLTAEAFHAEAPGLRGLSFSVRLKEYALFTRDQALRLINGEGSDEERQSRIVAVEGKLYQNSFLFGVALRKSLHIKTWKQAVEALELIYRIIGIEFHYEERGDCHHGESGVFTVKHCFFSELYSPEVCCLISALDEGLAAGLSEGGRLRFTRRITEGCSCCSGYFIESNESKPEVAL